MMNLPIVCGSELSISSERRHKAKLWHPLEVSLNALWTPRCDYARMMSVAEAAEFMWKDKLEAYDVCNA